MLNRPKSRIRPAVLAAAALAAGAVALTPSPASANRAPPFGGAYAHTPGSYLELPYTIATASAPAEYRQAIEDGMKAWFRTPTLVWPYASSFASSRVDFYVLDAQDDYFGIAHNKPCAGAGCTFTFTNVELNQPVLDQQNAFLRQKVVVHEVGHAMGLSHVLPEEDVASVMRQGILAFNIPQNHDVNDVNAIYTGLAEPSPQPSPGGTTTTTGAARYPIYRNVRALTARSHVVVRARIDRRLGTERVVPDDVSDRLPARKRGALGHLRTDFAVTVSAVLKGPALAAGDRLTVSQIGGQRARTRTVIEGEPIARVGDDYILFLRRRSDGSYIVTGGNQGRMVIRQGRLRPVSAEAAGMPVPRRLRGLSASAFVASFAAISAERRFAPLPRGRQVPLAAVPSGADQKPAAGRGPIPRPPGR